VVDELILLANIIVADPPRLPLADHVHRLVSRNRSPSCVELAKALLGFHASFDRSMILLQDVVQILHRSMAAAAAQGSFGFHCGNRRAVEAGLISVDDAGLGMRWIAESLAEQAFGRRGITPLSSDLLRNILFDDVEEQRYQGLVFSTLRSLLRARLIARMPWNYVDATNLSIHERRQWIKMAKSFGYEVQAVFFDVPLEVCLERNSKRDRAVSADVMRKMSEKLKPPVFEEGFAKITVVRVKNAG